ncbi:MAG: chemotaxis protein CheC [Rhodocyclaceae bacterium]|nr:chemotaxis protein CheC [Rhodocyclaceae bacterium]
MNLTPAECDATVELANIGISRAARQLSVLLDDEIRIQVPGAALFYNPADAIAELSQGAGGDIACVYQRLSGDLTGRVALLLPSRDGQALFHSLIGQGGAPLQGVDLRALEHEAMTEIGNIIISSCISAMADMLRSRITISVPRYAEASIEALIEDEAGEGRAALVLHARLKAVRRDVEGVIVLMFSASVASRVLDAVRRITEDGRT